MKCPVQGCVGDFEDQLISHTFRRDDQTVVVEGIPAHVCDVCGYTVLDMWVLDELLKIDLEADKPVRLAPVFEFGLEKAPAA